LLSFTGTVKTFGFSMVTDHAALHHSVRLRLDNPPEVSVLRKDFFFHIILVYIYGDHSEIPHENIAQTEPPAQQICR
jgi:hypothetical protein